ncbi:hypothetical protein BDV93DRAFT_243109 [Ceratobasidium sp. AG-I]|nr:hypothetical protein BDV93DRAFT_243109 [Ceratobasidium sp. AG-I]
MMPQEAWWTRSPRVFVQKRTTHGYTLKSLNSASPGLFGLLLSNFLELENILKHDPWSSEDEAPPPSRDSILSPPTSATLNDQGLFSFLGLGGLCRTGPGYVSNGATLMGAPTSAGDIDRRMREAPQGASYRSAPITSKVACAPLPTGSKWPSPDTDDSCHSTNPLKKSSHGIDTSPERTEQPNELRKRDSYNSSQLIHIQNDPPAATGSSVGQRNTKGRIRHGISQAGAATRPLRAPRSKGRPPIRKALSIGMNYTMLDEDRRLRFAVDDANRFAKCLKDRLNFEGHNVRTLTDGPDQPLTITTIRRELNWLFDNATAGDVLTLFISGHCVLNEGNKVVSFLTVEGKSVHAYMPSTIFLSHLGKVPQGCTVEIFLDCCHSAGPPTTRPAPSLHRLQALQLCRFSMKRQGLAEELTWLTPKRPPEEIWLQLDIHTHRTV